MRKEVTGPPASRAFGPDGAPTKAALGFAKAQGVPVESLRQKDTEKGPYVVAVVEQTGAAALDVLPGVLRQAALAISFPKSMRWPTPPTGDAAPAAVRFARPIRSLVALLDAEVVPVEIAGVKADRVTFGHPFLAPGPIELKDANLDAYLQALRGRRVMPGWGLRGRVVIEQVKAITGRYGDSPIPGDLASEVANLVEWPHAIEGTFDERFLEVPGCIVCAAMIDHQRYFPMWDAEGKLLNRFVVVSNCGPEQEQTVREGNERVLRARLEDARFFWLQDRKTPLADRVPRLEQVVYLGGLGNNLQRTRRLEELSVRIAGLMGLSAEATKDVRRAAQLCKADLVTGLVGEFPSLQGMVGCELALADGERAPVAEAIAEHYRPQSMNHIAPKTPEGAALALADKLDSIAGCFALGHLPSGNQDPYALRRNALGVLMILEPMPKVRLSDLVEAAREVLEAQAPELSPKQKLAVPVEQVLAFFRERLYNLALERGYAHDLIRATLSVGFDRPTPQAALNGNVHSFWTRLLALRECSQKTWWPALVEVVDRTYRIQRDLAEGGRVDEALLREEPERALAAVLRAEGGAVARMFDRGEYVAGAERFCELFAAKVHEFFDRVFVNVDDEALKGNRKALCGEIYHLFADRLADLYLIEMAAGSRG